MGTFPWMPHKTLECGRQGPTGRPDSSVLQRVPSPVGLSRACQMDKSASLKGTDLQGENSWQVMQYMAIELGQGRQSSVALCHPFMGLKFCATTHYSCCQATGN